MTKPLLLLKF